MTRKTQYVSRLAGMLFVCSVALAALYSTPTHALAPQDILKTLLGPIVGPNQQTDPKSEDKKVAPVAPVTSTVVQPQPASAPQSPQVAKAANPATPVTPTASAAVARTSENATVTAASVAPQDTAAVVVAVASAQTARAVQPSHYVSSRLSLDQRNAMYKSALVVVSAGALLYGLTYLASRQSIETIRQLVIGY